MVTIEITEFVTLALITLSSYLTGLITMLSITKRIKDKREERRVLYEERIEEYEKRLIEMMLRLNIIELRLRNKRMSHEISHVTYHTPKEVTESKDREDKIDDTEYKVLTLLLDGAKTSREIEVKIGRTREHTARLMKKLYEKGYVVRDTSDKPYKYSITEQGKDTLSQYEAA